VFEINLTDEPWTVTDVTAQIDKDREKARSEKAKRKADHHLQGGDLLRREILRRAEAREPAILKRAAERFLMAAYTMKEPPSSLSGRSAPGDWFRFGMVPPSGANLREAPRVPRWRTAILS